MTKKGETKYGMIDVQYESVLGDVASIVDAAIRNTLRAVNAAMTVSCWLIGRRIVEFEQAGSTRAEYGSARIERLAAGLTPRFARGFSRQNIQQMRLFYLFYPAEQIRQTVSGKSETLSAEFGFERLATAFPLPWSAYICALALREKRECAPVLRNRGTARRLVGPAA